MQGSVLVERVEQASALCRRLGLNRSDDAKIVSAILATIDASEYRLSAPTVRGLVSQTLIYGDVVARGLQNGQSNSAILLRTHEERIERLRECLSHLLEELRRPDLSRSMQSPSLRDHREQPLDEGA